MCLDAGESQLKELLRWQLCELYLLLVEGWKVGKSVGEGGGMADCTQRAMSSDMQNRELHIAAYIRAATCRLHKIAGFI
jgi:hypothetical protein